ncbi:MAG: FAD-dependent oxidoreductase [Lentisphaerae bacterium]|nr:FAD-dependent oxidoreductase [Lentisphaerota bacterium]MCP4100560.1 FAD-dependent oxidoreductase [Lentisphaerota bacterium]
MMKEKVVVVGVNHAGTSAIRTLLTQNPEIEVIAYDRNDNISFLGCGIALTVGGVVKNVNDLFYADCGKLEALGAKVRMKCDVKAIDTDKKELQIVDLETGEEFKDNYDKLIYAAGSWPIDFPIKNRELENVEICKLFQHAETLIEKANDESIKSVAVIGAGYIGIELAEAYHQKGKKVTLIDMQDRVVPTYFDPEFTDRLQNDMVAEGIDLVLGARVTEYDGIDGQVKKVITTKGTYDADLVIQCVGFKPNTELLPNADKLPNGALIVNSAMQTSIPDIYALGDTAAIYHAALKRHAYVALATNAVKTGIVAASQINGVEAVKLESIAGTNAICVFGNSLASTGLSEEAATNAGLKVKTSYFADNSRPEFMETADKVSCKLVFEEDTLRLVGAQIGSYGEQSHTECIYYLALAIQKGMSLLELAMTDVYFLPHFNKPFNFILSAIMQAVGLDYIKK